MIEIKNRLTGQVQVRAAVEAPEGATDGVKLGLAVKWAIGAGAGLAGANLTGASLSHAKLAGASLAGVNLGRASLAGADLTRADLIRASLAGADLTRADLSRACLAGADLTGAKLAGADLTGADLTGANLTRADLTGAKLASADLTGANLTATKGVIDAGTPNGWRTVGWPQDGCLAIRVGCRNKRLAEARAYWGEGRPDADKSREVRAALDYVEAIARMRGWDAEGPRS